MALFVATAPGGEIIGTVGCQDTGGGLGHVRGMAVLPGWQGRGVAERLLAEAEMELRRLGCDRVNLDTTRPLLRAMRFYVRQGYRATGRVEDFFGMEILEYVKDLTGTT